MDNIRALNQRYETVAWSALLIWLGVVGLVPGVPAGAGALGIGIILLELNLKRCLSGMPANEFSTALGVIALVLGAAKLSRSLLGVHGELQLFPLLLIVIGLIMMIRGASEPGRSGGWTEASGAPQKSKKR